VTVVTVAVISLLSWLTQAMSGKPPGRLDVGTVRESLALADTILQEGTNRREDTIRVRKYVPSRRPRYRPQDRPGDPFSNQVAPPPFLLDAPSNLNTEVELEDSMRYYNIDEKMGDVNYRGPSQMTFEEFSRYQQQQSIRNYWRTRNSGLDSENPAASRRLIPKIYNTSQLFDRIFGGNYVDIQPNGNVTLRFGARFNRNFNPTIPLRQQRIGDFDFDQGIQLNLLGNIGEKMKVVANWDTKANFEFENNLKLDYTGYDTEIIRKIEAGNVSLPLNNTLITGGQNLFGIKAQMQFGRLAVTTVMSNQRGRTDEVNIQNGAQSRDFEIRADAYDKDRHFFLSQYFRDQYNAALRNLPLVNTQVVIRRLEVYVTNNNRATENLRNVVALMDLGEPQPYRERFGKGLPPSAPARNDANTLYQTLTGNAVARNNDRVSDELGRNLGLQKTRDFEHIRARRLDQREYTFNPQLGYISLNSALLPEQVLGVAFEYTVNGQTYKVGELLDDYQNRRDDEVIFLKLLKATNPALELPTWDLMMKNIYSLNANQINRDNFQLNIVYKDDENGAYLTSIKEGRKIADRPLVEVFNLDNVNSNGDRPRDGNFDFLPGITVDPELGRIIFPVVEPFGSYLASKFDADETALREKYVYHALYDSTQSDAQQFTTKNKFFLRGRFQATSTDEIMLPGIRIAEGSVSVYSGGTRLVEGQDYQVFYDQGRVKILNPSYLSQASDLKVNFEKADIMNVVPRNLLGARFDYRASEFLNLGGTMLHLGERPFVNRVNIGDEPTNNTIYGLDVNFQRESRLLTTLVDKLPIVQTKAPSSITFGGEFAQLVPQNSKLRGEDGVSFIDDFEAARTPYTLSGFSNASWRLASTPFPFINGRTGRDYANERAKLAWYTIDQVYHFNNSNQKPKNITKADLENHYIRGIQRQEVFPNRDREVASTFEYTFDLAFFPNERGQYNYNPNLRPNTDGKYFAPSVDPRKNWGGISREIAFDTDFDNANIEYMEFWLMDPFIESNSDRNKIIDGENPPINNTTGGELILNLGNISEDVLKDGRYQFENGLPTPSSPVNTDTTAWGRVTRTQYLTDAFDNSTGARALQDIGLDGFDDAAEQTFFGNKPGMTMYRNVPDPSNDNFRHHLSDYYDNNNVGVLGRYKQFNGMEGNSPESSRESNYNLPDKEDLNRDNVISDLEQYYEYKINLKPGKMEIGQNYIVDKVVNSVHGDKVTWYQFRVPIRQPTGNVNNMRGYKSIRFMRMYLTEFEQPVVLRFVQFQFVANQWRRFQPIISDGAPCIGDCNNDAQAFTVSTVSVEQNGQPVANSIPYVLPPGIDRQRDFTSTIQRRQDEQSLQLCVEGLRDSFSKAVYKNISLDMLIYKRLKMFIHAQSASGVRDNEVNAFIRLGQDYTENYYEYVVPLKITPEGATNVYDIWNRENEVDIALEEFVNAKAERNRDPYYSANKRIPFELTLPDGKIIRVVGNPDFSDVRNVMVGIENPRTPDKADHSVCIWINELRVADFDKTAGWAATGRFNARLADVANITATGNLHTVGFGGIQQRIAQRARDNGTQFDLNANIAAEKFLPAKLGLVVPVSVQYGSIVREPRFDPLDGDTPLRQSLGKFSDDEIRNNYRNEIVDQVTTRSINLINVRKERTDPQAVAKPWDIENLAFTYAYSEILRTDILTDRDLTRNYTGGVAYSYSSTPKNYTPFANWKIFDSPYLKLFKDFNFTPLPNRIMVRADLDRRYNETFLQRIDNQTGLPSTRGIDPTFRKQFYFDRIYDVKWDLTKNLILDYTATNRAVVDEPDGQMDRKNLDLQWKHEQMMRNLRRGGRNTNFNQVAAVTYRVPFDKLPFTDWLSAETRYAATFNWIAGSTALTSDSLQLGNTIQNSTTASLTGKVDLVRLYNKVKFLKGINEQVTAQEQTGRPPLPGTPGAPVAAPDTAGPKRDLKVLKGVLRVIMSARSINFNYERNEGTLLPGYLPGTRSFGLSEFGSPGLPFVLGEQVELGSLFDRTYSNGWYTDSSQYLVTPLSSLFTENLTARTSLEPFKSFIIQLDASQNRNHVEEVFYRLQEDLDGNLSDQPVRQSPISTGSFRTSFIALQTLFENGPNNQSPAFERFIQYRKTVQSRLNDANPYTSGENHYGLNSQDVLMPAFLSAYQGRSIDGFKPKAPNPFSIIPLPNWNINYNGLSQLPFFQQYFSSFSLNHAYVGTYSVMNYSTSLDYSTEPAGFPTAVNPSGEFIPYHIINQVVITERMAPLIGVNFRTKNNITTRLEYKTERNLLLNMTNAQITEIGIKDFVLGMGYVTNNFRLPFNIGGSRTLKNDLTFRLDLAIRDNVTTQRNIVQDDKGLEVSENTATNGSLQMQLRPTIDYVVDQRLNLQFFFTRTISHPHVNTSFRNTVTEGGIQLRYNLGQ
jgi:cell surface protein SprA